MTGAQPATSAAILTRPRYVIAVPDLARSSAFYRDVLGFDVEPVGPPVEPLGHPGFYFYSRGDCVIFAGECPDALPPAATGDHSYYAYVEVEPVDAFFAEVTARGAEVTKPLRDEPWGMREFGVRTADGHRMMFGGRVRAR